MSVEESQTMTYPDGVQMTTASRKEEEHQEREMFREEISEQKQTQVEEKEDGAVLILSDCRKESKQELAAETQETKHYEESAVIRGDETYQVTESSFKTETIETGLEEHLTESEEQKIELESEKGAQPRPTSSAYSDSEPESPRSPSPKVSPVSPRVSQPDLQVESSSPYGESGEEDGSSGEEEGGSSKDITKETEQELLDEMIVKDVPESESTTDPVRRFEETNVTSAGIESIQEAQEDSDSE